MSFQFIRDHAGRWPIRLMCPMSRPAVIKHGATVQKAPERVPTVNCLPMSIASTASIMAVTAVPGCTPHFVRKAGRQGAWIEAEALDHACWSKRITNLAEAVCHQRRTCDDAQKRLGKIVQAGTLESAGTNSRVPLATDRSSPSSPFLKQAECRDSDITDQGSAPRQTVNGGR